MHQALAVASAGVRIAIVMMISEIFNAFSARLTASCDVFEQAKLETLIK